MTSTSLENWAARERTVVVSVDPSAVAGEEVEDDMEGEEVAEDPSVLSSDELASDVADPVTGDVVVIATSVAIVLMTSMTTAWLGG